MGDGCVDAHCQGRFVRCGDTSSHEAVSGLYLRWEMSSRTLSGIVNKADDGGGGGGVTEG